MTKPAILDHLRASLESRRAEGALRTLGLREAPIDFTSNDYLGVVRNGLLAPASASGSGSTGSRLLSGNSRRALQLEESIASFHGAEAAILFNSGYDANLGLLSSIADRNDTILFDSLAHASMRDGMRLGLARAIKFAHNDLDDLRTRLRAARGRVVIAVESLYSMDGDVAPLEDLCEIAEQHGAALVVDEAHATGVYGRHGEGLVAEKGLEGRVFARLHTYGKALGAHGASIVGPRILIEYLTNFARSLIYSTFMAPHAVEAIRAAYALLPSLNAEREAIRGAIGHFRAEASALDLPVIRSATQIQGVLVPGNRRVKSVSDSLMSKGIDARPILSPTVPQGSERLRVCLHSFNSKAEISAMLGELSAILREDVTPDR